MFKRRRLTRLAYFGTFLLFIVACAVAPEAAAPPPAEEPAAPEITAPVEVDEPAEEEPASEQPTEVLLFPATLPPSISGLKTPTPHIDLPPDGILPTPLTELPDTGGGEGPQPAILESRRLTLEYPPEMRTGDSARIRMQLEVDDRGNITPTAVVEGNVVTGEVIEIPNLYETHLVVAEARLDMAGMEVRPPGLISESLTPGKSVTFYWSARPEDSGRYEGTVWLHLRFIPMTTLSGEQESRIAVSAQFLEIEVKSFMGFLNGGVARGIGALGSLIGSVLGFPFVGDFVKWLWGKIRRR